jgi:enterochelin esterase-like enzyme
MRHLAVFPVVAALAAVLASSGRAAGPPGLPSSWVKVSAASAGGAVWQGRIPDTFAPWDRRPSAVYLPPGYNPSQRYPVIYLLHGMAGNPSSYWDGLQLATVADALITTGATRPFIAVMPVAGPTIDPDTGEWAGVWEDYVVHDVVPWIDEHLPTVTTPQGRALEGLCAGGYGAVDIGLRHPGIFGTLGSWEGYFAPVFRDGPFVHASRSDLAAHDPTLLVRREAGTLRRERVRFYVSVGGNHADILRVWSLDFARELRTLHLEHELWLLPPADHGHFWRSTVPSALAYAAAAFRA